MDDNIIAICNFTTCTFLLICQLAIGTNKGNLMLYNRATLRKVPLLGKHTRGIVDGLWLDATTLACASEDKTVGPGVARAREWQYAPDTPAYITNKSFRTALRE